MDDQKSKTDTEEQPLAVPLDRLVRQSERPRATENNRSRFVTHCIYREGMSVKEAYDAFEKANRGLWAAATA